MNPFMTLDWTENVFKLHIEKSYIWKNRTFTHTKGMFRSRCTFIAQAVPWVPVPLSSDPHSQSRQLHHDR